MQSTVQHLGEVVEAGDDELQGLAGAAEAAEDEDLLAHEAGVAAHPQCALLLEVLAALQEGQQLVRRKLRVQLHLHLATLLTTAAAVCVLCVLAPRHECQHTTQRAGVRQARARCRWQRLTLQGGSS